MNIVILEPFFTGSHAAWATEYARFSGHRVDILSLPGRHWKWRMHGGTVALADNFLAGGFVPDLLVATDMLDLTTFLALTRSRTSSCRTAVYFHENQLSYPWSPDDSDRNTGRDIHYAFINYASALAADAVFFNSAHHMRSFLEHLPPFLKSMPDKRQWKSIEAIERKSQVLHLGMDLKQFDPYRAGNTQNNPPLVVWNHRWEYDKNPEAFFRTLARVADKGVDFRLAVLGERFAAAPAVFESARARLADKIVQFGFVTSFSEYAEWLHRGDILPVTSNHDFFGASVVQAIYCGCRPLLPRRLAYPEHVPERLHSLFLYDTDEQLEQMLEIALGMVDRGEAGELVTHACRYDWSTLAPLYDEIFENVAAG